jgi:hypothetical protein
MAAPDPVDRLEEFRAKYEAYWALLDEHAQMGVSSLEEFEAERQSARREVTQLLPRIERLVTEADQDYSYLRDKPLEWKFRPQLLDTIDRTIGAYRDGLNRDRHTTCPVEDGSRSVVSWKQVQENFKSHPVVWIVPMLFAAFLAGWAAHAKYGSVVDHLLQSPPALEKDASPSPARGK